MTAASCLNDLSVTTHELGNHDMPCIAMESPYNLNQLSSTSVVLVDLARGLDAEELEELSLSPESEDEDAATSSMSAAGSAGPCSGNSKLCP